MKKISPKDKKLAEKTLVDAFDLLVTKIKKDTKHIIIDRKGNEILAGEYKIVKNDDLYDIYHKGKLVYNNLYLVDSAFVLIESELNKKKYNIKQVKEYEKEYAKWHNDLVHFIEIRKSTDADAVYNKCSIEDRYDIAKDHVNRIRTEVRHLRTPV